MPDLTGSRIPISLRGPRRLIRSGAGALAAVVPRGLLTVRGLFPHPKFYNTRNLVYACVECETSKLQKSAPNTSRTRTKFELVSLW